MMIVHISFLISYTLALQINVYSNQIVSINGYEGTGNNLMGVSSYGGGNYAKDATTRDHLVDDLGVNTIGYGPVMSNLFDDAKTCCSTEATLQNYISSGQACTNFKGRWSASIWGTDEYKIKGIENMIYLRETCAAENQPAINHCISAHPGLVLKIYI